MNITDLFLPLIIAAVLVYALIRGTDVFAEFTQGVKEGLRTVLDIFPALFCLVMAVSAFRASGGAQLLSELLSPVFSAAGMPAECAPLVLLRPFSGSGALAVFDDILRSAGPDSEAGRIASVVLGSSETTFYTLSVYFSAAGIKKTRYALPAALCGDIAGFLASAAAVHLLLP